MRQRWINMAATCAIVALLYGVAAPAQAIGYYNLPGNVAQWLGYGNGAGYHACLVLGPTTAEGWFAHHEVRLPYPPGSPCDGGGCGAAPVHFGPTLLPPDRPENLPSPAAMRPQILR